ncbi:MAG TPA: VTT domain-containing protein [Gemmatimonadales bacterium]
MLVILALATALLLARPVHDQLLGLFAATERLIHQRPAWGMAAFVLLAALSAMLAFFSSALLIPVAIYAWGPATCVALLWSGWFAGGLFTYAIGRYLGRPVVERLVSRDSLAHYEKRARSGRGLVGIVLLQLAVPSDIAGYAFGLIRCPFPAFVAALAVAEIPYAVGAVYLGVSFLQRRLVPLLTLGLAGVLLSVFAFRVFHRHSGITARSAG